MSDLALLPLYECHKQVRAAKIKMLVSDAHGPYIITDTGLRIRVEANYIAKHMPTPGGYFVLYGDGYQSFSPAAAFEQGYSRVEP
ncbi:MAG TPA: hypothetical protein VN436_14330 [Holophaga sp.]|nr:hypothetical protein [Holophaga sp.]